MCIQSKAIDGAIVSVRPETDPKNQIGESALANSTYTEKHEQMMWTITHQKGLKIISSWKRH